MQDCKEIQEFIKEASEEIVNGRQTGSESVPARIAERAIEILTEIKIRARMDFHEYQRSAMRTAKPDATIWEATMGLAGEAGETIDYLKKVYFHDHEYNPATLKKEIGDVLWYMALIAKIHGFSLQEVAELNIQKLWERYPEGFDPGRSRNRKNEK